MNVTMVTIVNSDQLTYTLRRKIIAQLTRAMNEVALPQARAEAPGSIPSRITVVPTRDLGGGNFEGGLSMPAKYASVEYGSGVYGDSGQPIHIEPTERHKAKAKREGHRAALVTGVGVFSSVTIDGQKGKHFLSRGIKKGLEWFHLNMFSKL